MDKLQKFKQYSRRAFRRLTSHEAETVTDYNLATHVNEEILKVSWVIENMNRCTMTTGEFLESPPFLTGFYNVFKWTIRIYPKGQKSPGKVELLLCKISPKANVFVICDLSAKLTPESAENSKQAPRKLCHKFCYTPEAEDKESVKEYVQESELLELFPTANWVASKSVKITCDLTIKYEDKEVNNGDYNVGYLSSLSSDFKELYKTKDLSDVTLEVGEKCVPFPVHKVILAARSKVFSAMFTHDMQEKCASVIRIEDVQPDAMDGLLQYIYTGKVDGLHMEKALDLFSAANKYSLEELQNLCVGIVMSNISTKNVCQIAILADMYSVPKLKLATNYIFRKYKCEIFQKKEWKKLTKDQPLLASEIIDAVSLEFYTNF